MRVLLWILLAVGGVAWKPSGFAAPALQELQCPGCKAKLKPDAKFCTQCGQQISQRECAGCKAPLKPDAKFCTSCGKKVEEAPAPKPEAAKKEPPKPDPEKKGADVSKPAPKPDKPVGQERAPDAVKETRGQELEKYGVSAEQINRAIDRGAMFLAKHYARTEFGYDQDYLAAYALIHTRQYQENGKLREKIDRFLRGSYWLKSSQRTYVTGLRALALEATSNPDLRALTRECAEYLIEAQGPQGTWNYKEDLPVAAAEEKGREESTLSISGGEPLDEEVKRQELVKKDSCKNPRDGDNSTTQFAILGLHAASKCGFQVPKAVWQKCLKETAQRACKDGGWHYNDALPNSYGSMTCAGLSTMALCRYYLGEKDYLDDAKLKAGLKWLADNFEVARNPKQGDEWPLYYLYSVERVGVFFGTETIGDHRWYPMGARHLIDTQDPKEGSWKEKHDVLIGTSFALLFLTRATPSVRVLKRGGKGWVETHALTYSQNFMFILDASGSMRDEIDGKEKFQIAKDVVEGIVRNLPPGAHVGLRVYGHRRSALDEDADIDTELLIPVGPLNPEGFMKRIRPLKCKGKTPLTLSLIETIKDISPVSADIDLVTVLLTDGGESTRGAKPTVAAAQLAASRQGMKLHVVAFDINDDDERDQLQKTAAAGGGRYFPARKSADLSQALSAVTFGGVPYVVTDNDGRKVVQGKLGDRHELFEGKYTFSIEPPGQKRQDKALWINTDVTTHVCVNVSGW